MAPAVALGAPDDLAPVGDVEAVALARVVDERRHPLVDQRARLACRGVHLDHAEDLVPALVVLERERAAVLPPHQP